MEQASFYTVFTIDNQLYGIDIGNVGKIIRAVSITPIPHGPESLLGLLNAGGTMIPVVNIRKKFCRNEREISANDRIIFFQAKTALCFLADTVEGVVQFTPSQLQQPQEIHPALGKYITGVGQYNACPVILINLTHFFNETELQDIATFTEQHVQ